jgi:putative transposase
MTTSEMKADAVVAKSGEAAEGGDAAQAGQDLIGRLVAQAREQGLDLTGEGGLLQRLTKRVLESALEGEITDQLGYDKHDADAKISTNSRSGRRSKTVTTDVGPVQIDAPRDREGSFGPRIVAKRQRRLTGVDEMVLSLSAKGLTHGEISAHLAEVYGASVSKQTISTITDKVLEGMAEWQNRPLDHRWNSSRVSGDLPGRHPREDLPACRTRSRTCGPRRSCRPASCICCATASGMPPDTTGTRSRRFSSLSTPHRPKPPR